jgi:hypothetical protein
MGEPGVEADDQLTHAGDQGHRLSRRDQPGIEAGQHATTSAGRRQGCHIQGATGILPPAADLAFAVPLSSGYGAMPSKAAACAPEMVLSGLAPAHQM